MKMMYVKAGSLFDYFPTERAKMRHDFTHEMLYCR
jgi:hypothetical protein